jgi:uncharacterized membrane protein
VGKNNMTIIKKIRNNIKQKLLAGILLFLPFGVALLVMRWLFGSLKSILQPIIKGFLTGIDKIAFFNVIPDTFINIAVVIASIFILIFSFYLIGSLGQFLIGRRLIAIGETILMQIPLISTIYSATKQVIQSFSHDKAAFKSVVVVQFPRAGFYALAFLTGYINDSQGKKYCKVFIPTTPNPTTGFFEIIPVEEVRETAMTIEDGFKTIISGGILSSDIF